MNSHDSVRAYENELAPQAAKLVKLLREEIEHRLPAATSSVWHGHPVWFDGDNPIVGYDVRKAVVTILFWNGRELGEPGLHPVGKHKAAGKAFRTADDLDLTELQRCLDKARTNVLDSAAYVRTLREDAKRRRAGGAEAPTGMKPARKPRSLRPSSAGRSIGGEARSPTMNEHRIFSTPFATVYPMYVQKAERKGRTRQEVDEVICWLTGYDLAGLKRQMETKADFRSFFASAPAIHPNSDLIRGVVCGVRVEDIQDPLMRRIRQLDKLVDELAKGRSLAKILGRT